MGSKQVVYNGQHLANFLDFAKAREPSVLPGQGMVETIMCALAGESPPISSLRSQSQPKITREHVQVPDQTPGAWEVKRLRQSWRNQRLAEGELPNMKEGAEELEGMLGEMISAKVPPPHVEHARVTTTTEKEREGTIARKKLKLEDIMVPFPQ